MFDTVIRIYVCDQHNNPIRGAAVTWTILHEGQAVELGPVTTQGRADKPVEIQLANKLDEPFVDVTASYQGVTKTERIRIDKRQHSINLDIPMPDPKDTTATSPLAILNAARRAVPAVDFALGAAGIAAAGAIIVGLLGDGRAAVIILGGVFIAMLLLFAFARLVAAQNRSAILAGVVLLWAVTLFFCTFLLFTTTAVAVGWPPAWASLLGLQSQYLGSKLPPKS